MSQPHSNNNFKIIQEEIAIILNNPRYNTLQNRFLDLESELSGPEIWLYNEKVLKVTKEMQEIKEHLNLVEELKDQLENYQLAKQLSEHSQLELIEIKIKSLYQSLQLKELFNGTFDSKNAIMSIHAGAGGVDAQDWSAMLMSMYQTFSKDQGLEVKILELNPGPEGGVKSATFEIIGPFAYGLLKEEAGVHRLVRISPFNSGKTRETSFALIEVIPDQIDDMISAVIIKDEDLEWDYYMASGKGGQSVNTTYSAVRLTHRPSQIIVTCQNERSQQQNKEIALKHLKNKLNLQKVLQTASLKQELRGELSSPEWGNQIRNYVMHPYKLIKDTRSGYETSNIEDVLIYGRLMPIILSVKQKKQNILLK
jgi:peptide chain release factor 2